MRKLCSALVISLLLLTVGVTCAQAQVTVGQLATPDPPALCTGGPNDIIQSSLADGNSYVVPAAGVITSWSTEAASGAGQRLKLKVYRPLGGTSFLVVGADGPRSLTPAVLDTFPIDIPVQAGDLIGLNDENAPEAPNACLMSTTESGDIFGASTSPPAEVGATITMNPIATGFKLNLSASLLEAPKISSVSPSSGTTAGGTTVVISGSEFAAVQSVMFGANPARLLHRHLRRDDHRGSPSGDGGRGLGRRHDDRRHGDGRQRVHLPGARRAARPEPGAGGAADLHGSEAQGQEAESGEEDRPRRRLQGRAGEHEARHQGSDREGHQAVADGGQGDPRTGCGEHQVGIGMAPRGRCGPGAATTMSYRRKCIPWAVMLLLAVGGAPSAAAAAVPVFGFQSEGSPTARIAEDARALGSVGVDGVNLTGPPGIVSHPTAAARRQLSAAHAVGRTAVLLVGNFSAKIGDFSEPLAWRTLHSSAATEALARRLAADVRGDGWDGISVDFEALGGATAAAWSDCSPTCAPNSGQRLR